MAGIIRYSSVAIFTLVLLLPIAANAYNIPFNSGQNGSHLDPPPASLNPTCYSGNYSCVNIAFLNYNVNATSGEDDSQWPPQPAQLKSITQYMLLCHLIRVCQVQGIKVLLSVGAGTNHGFSLSSPAAARSFAGYIRNNFLGGHSLNMTSLPAVLDVVDFNVIQKEGSRPHYYADLAARLSDLGQRGGRKLHLSAGPQCPFTDPRLMAVGDPACFKTAFPGFGRIYAFGVLISSALS
ncbi:hypothetical protein V2J09_019463 [Rumex salicifolius]